MEKAIKNCLIIEDKTEGDIAALATYYMNLGIILSKVNDSGCTNHDDLDKAYEMFEECEKYRMLLAKNNPKDFLQPLGMILLRMSGLAWRNANEYDAKLNLMKARFVFERTDLKREQYEGALQQMSDNISKMKNFFKSFFGLFRFNEDRLKEEFEEFVDYFK